MDGRFSVGLEQGADGGFLAQVLDLPGCAAVAGTAEAATEAAGAELGRWLGFLAFAREPVPPDDAELELSVDEWIATDAAVLAGESRALFQADLAPLDEAAAQTGVRRLGDLRGILLGAIRGHEARLDRVPPAGLSARAVLEELARAQWWLLSRLGSSPMAEVPERTVDRLDTAMALVVQRFAALPADARALHLTLDGEEWTPRKVLRRLLWLEWNLGRAALWALESAEPR